jgi:hypothetical protein
MKNYLFENLKRASEKEEMVFFKKSKITIRFFLLAMLAFFSVEITQAQVSNNDIESLNHPPFKRQQIRPKTNESYLTNFMTDNGVDGWKVNQANRTINLSTNNIKTCRYRPIRLENSISFECTN